MERIREINKTRPENIFHGHLVIEYAAFGDSDVFFQKKLLSLSNPTSVIFSLALQLAHAVYWLHRNGIVHRDLHRKNVLIDSLTEIDYDIFDENAVAYKFEDGVWRFHNVQKFNEDDKNVQNIKVPFNLLLVSGDVPSHHILIINIFSNIFFIY